MSLHGRERKVNVDAMSQEQVDNLSVQIGEKVRSICDEAAEKVNSILAIYGMSAKIAIKFNKLPSKMASKTQAPGKRGKKAKQDNLK